MGYYIDTKVNHGKADFIVANYGGEIIRRAPASFGEIPAGKALIVVVDNGLFEAAGFAYSEPEFRVFTQNPNDFRPREYVLMDRADAVRISRYPGA